jgi:hypothetical protein
MHTAVCTFSDRDAAERAVERLLNAGFSRRDVHIEHRDDDATSAPSTWGVEREIAVGPRVVERVASFFGDLFGADHPHRETYSRHVDSGRCVVVVDAHHEPEADRARSLMQDMKADHMDVVHRPTQRPLRELLSRTPAQVESPEAVQAAARSRDSDWIERAAPVRPEERAFAQGQPADRTVPQPDRATAQGDASQRTFDFGDVGRNAGTASRSGAGRSEKDDLDKVGLRYSDKDSRER